jgi:hypothetical protein
MAIFNSYVKLPEGITRHMAGNRWIVGLFESSLSDWCQGRQQNTGAAGPRGCGQVTQQEAGEERQQQQGPEKQLVIHWNGDADWTGRIFWKRGFGNYMTSSPGRLLRWLLWDWDGCHGAIICIMWHQSTPHCRIPRSSAQFNSHMHRRGFQPAVPFDWCQAKRGVGGRSSLAEFWWFINLT